jgi:hypothetical protein
MDNQYPKTITLHLRTQFLGQRPGKYNAWQVSMVEKTLPYSQVAMIVCDMWDKHWSLGASERVNAMAPRMNAVLSMARARGATIIHAPSDTMEFFEGSPGLWVFLKSLPLRRLNTPTFYSLSMILMAEAILERLSKNVYGHASTQRSKLTKKKIIFRMTVCRYWQY